MGFSHIENSFTGGGTVFHYDDANLPRKPLVSHALQSLCYPLLSVVNRYHDADCPSLLQESHPTSRRVRMQCDSPALGRWLTGASLWFGGQDPVRLSGYEVPPMPKRA